MVKYHILHRWFLDVRKSLGYTRTKITLIRIMYWLLGEFYYSKVFDHRLTRFWIIFNATNTLMYFIHCFSYLLLTTRPEFSNVLYTGNALITGFYLMILLQLMAYVYRQSTFEAFEKLDQDIDDIPSNELFPQFDFVRRKKYSMRVVVMLAMSQLGSMICYEICSNLYLIDGYTKNKLKDPNSYFYPIYCERVESLGVFGIMLGSQLFAAFPLILVYLLIPSYLMIIVGEFYRKFQQLCDTINWHSRMFSIRYEESAVVGSNSGIYYYRRSLQEHSFIQNIRSCVQLHEKLIKAISLLKPYFEMNMSISIGVFMYLEIVLCYFFISINDESPILRIKNINYAVIITTIFFVNCLAGKLFSDMEDMFREAVYDIPWYYLSPSSRKFIHVFLTRAHMKISFKALKVYSVNMVLFLRFYQQVYSVVNVLRQTIKKKN